ncbi:Cyclin-D3-1 [Acorus calamus]|uniref:Cyclin-D3-1 n=1 Tax=Acorus calamus TaxID=4465 RepID=A0AAV9DDH6_ACOCL|nr:Cyclin-D3-1 [Acorus calamus]
MAHLFLHFDLLCCEEHHWDVEEEQQEEVASEDSNNTTPSTHHHHQPFSPSETYETPDEASMEEELITLSIKERENVLVIKSDPDMVSFRRHAVDWILTSSTRHGFNALTSILSINYLDRFISSSGPVRLQSDKPWMSQLVAVACLSVAAKVEETQVPLLLDLQVEDTKYLFEVRTVQRMELLLLSTLGWKMNPATALTFIDHLFHRLRLRHREFRRRCERVLLTVTADPRSTQYLPSEMAATTMRYVIGQMEFLKPVDEFDNELSCILNIDKDKMEACYQLILETMNFSYGGGGGDYVGYKRKHVSSALESPMGVGDLTFSSDSLNSSQASSVSSSPEPIFKKMRLSPLQGNVEILLSGP